MKVIDVPERDELIRRLAAIADERHLHSLYRVLAHNTAGKELSGVGVANGIVLSYATYVSGHETPVVAAVRLLLAKLVPAFTNDPETQADAVAHLEAAGFRVV